MQGSANPFEISFLKMSTKKTLGKFLGNFRNFFKIKFKEVLRKFKTNVCVKPFQAHWLYVSDPLQIFKQFI